jgi:hypothetical protein
MGELTPLGGLALQISSAHQPSLTAGSKIGIYPEVDHRSSVGPATRSAHRDPRALAASQIQEGFRVSFLGSAPGA